jgi:peptidoglycan/LPS O-acetylase OafA/YrhL
MLAWYLRWGGMEYRPDIDGLRAVAVVPVVLFHSHLEFMRGGFVGVDVFFVISGYLITLMILTEMRAGDFSIAKFYQRRILRIFPALLVVMAFTVGLGWLYSMPDDYKRLGESVTSVSVFLSNLYFWKDSGYFGAAPEGKPLLHTWSLSVEEQFYVLFPIYLILIRSRSRQLQIGITSTVWLLSLLLSSVGVMLEPTATFFFLPTRMWELLTGSLVAMQAIPSTTRRPVLTTAWWAGLLLILAAVLVYDEKLPFPGISALVPVFGAALVIWAGSTPTPLANRILSGEWLVLIGKIRCISGIFPSLDLRCT